MRLYGALSELAELVIRLASGKTVKVSSENQPSGASEKIVKIPDMGQTDTDKIVLETTSQSLSNKTLAGTVTSGMSNIKVQNADITGTNLLQLPGTQNISLRYLTAAGNKLYLGTGTNVKEIVDLDSAGQVLSGKTINASINSIVDINPVSGSTFATVGGHADKVVKYDAGGIPQVAKILNANIDDAAGIAGSKLSDNSVAVAKLASMSSADLAGKITDETGSGSLVFGTGPTLTNAKVSGYEDFNHTTTPGANPTGAVRVYAKSDNKLYTLSPGGIEQAVGSGGSVLLINKASHGFVAADVGCPVYLNASGDYVKAKADAANTAEVAGLINKIVDSSNFEVCLGGEVSSVGANAAASLVPGEVYFLSPTTAGALTATEPTVVGQVRKPVGIARTANSIDFFNMLGTVVGGANLRTQLTLNGAALVSQTTNIQNVTAYTAGRLEGWVFIDATTDRQFHLDVRFVKNAAGAWNCSYQTTGDTPPAGFNVDVIVSGSDAFVQVQMPPVAGWVSGSVNFALNAPAVGTTLPLQIASTSVSFDTIQAKDANGLTFKENDGATVGSVSDAGVWTFPTSISLGTAGGGYTPSALSKYQENTYTATEANGTPLINVSTAYTRIGRMVHVIGFFTVGSTASASAFRLTMPFSHLNSSYGGGTTMYNSAGFMGFFRPDSTTSATIMVKNDNSSVTCAMVSGALIGFSYTYYV